MSQKVFLISPEAPPHQFAGAGDVRKINSGGIRLGTLDNTKGNADHLLTFVVENLQKVLNISSVVALRKNNPSTPAPGPVLDRLAAECDFVVSAMGD